MTLAGNGAELLCHPGNRPFALWKSSDIEIKNFQLDCSPLPITQGSIIGVNRGGGFFDVDIDSGYALPEFGLYPENWRADAVFTDSTGKYTHVWGRIKNVYQPAGFPTNRIRLAFQAGFTNVINSINSGEKIAVKIDFGPEDRSERDIRHTDGDYKNAGNGNVEIRRCQNIRVSDIDSYAAPSFTSYIFGSEDVVVDDFNVLQEPGTDRILVSNKDGFHCKSCPVPPIIKNCYFERLADDAVNVSDMADVIDEIFDADSFETHYSDNILSGSVLTDGQPVLIVDPDIPAKVGEAVVTNVVDVNYRRKQFDLINISYESGWSSIASNHCFYIQREKPAEIESCEFGTSLKTGLVSRGPLNARHNIFTDTAYGIHHFYEGGASEGPYAYGLVAESNTFNNVTIGGIVCYVACSGSFNVDMGIELRDNLVDQDAEGHGFKLANVNGADIEDNVFFFDSSVPTEWQAIVLSGCANITESGNTGDRL